MSKRLFNAIYEENLNEIIKLVNNSVNINDTNNSIIYTTICGKDKYLTKYPLEKCSLKRINVEQSSIIQSKPLTMASMTGNYQIVLFLLKSGADVDVKDGEGYTSLYYAYDYNRIDIMDLLLSFGANPDLNLGDENNTVRDIAIRDWNQKVLELIEKYKTSGRNVKRAN
jgi:ankyrin repeat protein